MAYCFRGDRAFACIGGSIGGPYSRSKISRQITHTKLDKFHSKHPYINASIVYKTK